MKSICLILSICFQIAALAQTGSEIILFDVDIKSDNIILSNPVNITNHKGYDNQPFFYKKDIYYSSDRDSTQKDIKKYNYQSHVTSIKTTTKDNEFSPTITPDQNIFPAYFSAKTANRIW